MAKLPEAWLRHDVMQKACLNRHGMACPDLSRQALNAAIEAARSAVAGDNVNIFFPLTGHLAQKRALWQYAAWCVRLPWPRGGRGMLF
ncbi:MAG: hypothetical protein LBQ10_02210 [Desulfovibrio sp.]|jgi:hypothetical protein|nr:hypothetical protein [Desulfovibrio sp.]